MIPCVIYAAKSTEDTHGSIADQRRQVLDAITREDGRTDVGSFDEENQSGYRKNRGPQLEAALQAAVAAADEHGEAELWVFHSTRLGRGTGRKGEARALGALLYDLRAKGVTVRSVSDDAFTTNQQMWGIASDQASKYSEDLAAHTTRGIRQRQRAGDAFGAIPFGYTTEPLYDADGKPVESGGRLVKRRVLDREAAPLLEAIWSMIEAGEGWGSIARSLNARGSRTMKARPWTGPVVRGLAKNSAYIGEKGYPALVDQDRWDRIQAIIADTSPAARQRRKGGRELQGDFLLHRLAFCAHCGEPMHVRSEHGGYYTCRAKRRGTGLCDSRAVPAQIADERVLAHLETFIASVEGWIAERVAAGGEEREAHERALRRELAALGDLERLRDKLLAEYERQVDDGKSTAHLALEAVERKDRDLEAQRKRIDGAEALLSEWQEAPDVDAALDYYNALSKAVRERIGGSQSVKDVNAALTTIVAGIWLEYDGKQLEASFALRPLDGRDDASRLARVLSAETPSTRWTLHEPVEGRRMLSGFCSSPDDDDAGWQDLAEVAVDQPTGEGRSSPCRASEGCCRLPG